MNLKIGVWRKQSPPNFLKKELFLPPDTHTYVCVSRGKRCSFFGKLDVLCFSWNTHFEIHPFSLLATIEHFALVYRGDIPGIVYRRPWIYLQILLLPDNLHQNIYLFHEWWIWTDLYIESPGWKPNLFHEISSFSINKL